MKYVEQDQMRHRALFERQFIAIADNIKPGIREEVAADCTLDMLTQITDAGTDLDYGTHTRRINELLDRFVEMAIDITKQGF